MSNSHSIPEFLIGMTIFLSVFFMIIFSIITIYDKIKNNSNNSISKIEGNQFNIQSKTTFDNLNKKPFVEIFNRVEINNLDDLLRYSKGSPGETSRVIANNYYTLFYENYQTPENVLRMLEHRNLILTGVGIGLKEKFIDELSEKYTLGITYIIFAIAVFEDKHFNFNSGFYDYTGQKSSFKVIAEEYNKICPFGKEESIEIYDNKITEIRELFYKYNYILIF